MHWPTIKGKHDPKVNHTSPCIIVEAMSSIPQGTGSGSVFLPAFSSAQTPPLSILRAEHSCPWPACCCFPTANCCDTCLLLAEKLQTQSRGSGLWRCCTDRCAGTAGCYIYSVTGTTDISPPTQFEALQQLLPPSVSLPAKPTNWLSSSVHPVEPTQKTERALETAHKPCVTCAGWEEGTSFRVITVGLRHLFWSVTTSHL